MSRPLPAGWALLRGGAPGPSALRRMVLEWLVLRTMTWRALASGDPVAARRAHALAEVLERAKGGR